VPNEKISQLTYAPPALSGDYIPVARASAPGQNLSVTAADIAALAQVILGLISPDGSLLITNTGVDTYSLQVSPTGQQFSVSG